MKSASSFEAILENTAAAARDMWLNGWAEDGAGNLSVRLEAGLLRGQAGAREGSEWVDMGWEVPGLGGATFLVTASGSLFRCLRDRPSEGCGVVELDAQGARYRVLWGFEPAGRPSSEMQSHLAVHARRAARAEASSASAVVHVHAPNLVALTCALAPDTISLTRLLWSMHSECVALLPEGIEVAPWCLPGSAALSEATARGFEKRRVAVWPFHGVVAAGGSVDEAMGLIEVVEKASEIYLKAAAAGGPGVRLTDRDVRDIAAAFGVEPDESFLDPPRPAREGKGRARQRKGIPP